MPDIEVTLADGAAINVTVQADSPVIETNIVENAKTSIDVDIQNLGVTIDTVVQADSPVIDVSITNSTNIIEVDLSSGQGGSAGSFYEIGNGLKVEGDVLSVDAANDAEKDNTKPITSAAVYTEIGNINVLLATI